MARVLIVEDEPTDRVILANLLERMGHEVYVASDGEEGFKTYLKNRIEIEMALMPTYLMTVLPGGIPHDR